MASELDEAMQRELEQREQEAAQDWASLGLYTPSGPRGQGPGREIKDTRRAIKGQRPQRWVWCAAGLWEYQLAIETVPVPD